MWSSRVANRNDVSVQSTTRTGPSQGPRIRTTTGRMAEIWRGRESRRLGRPRGDLSTKVHFAVDLSVARTPRCHNRAVGEWRTLALVRSSPGSCTSAHGRGHVRADRFHIRARSDSRQRGRNHCARYNADEIRIQLWRRALTPIWRRQPLSGSSPQRESY